MGVTMTLMLPQAPESLYELASRQSDGIEVALVSSAAEDRVLLSARDRRTDEWLAA
jgi:hypothetical protein